MACEKSQIERPVVGVFPVAMMNGFPMNNRPTQHLFHYEYVLINITRFVSSRMP